MSKQYLRDSAHNLAKINSQSSKLPLVEFCNLQWDFIEFCISDHQHYLSQTLPLADHIIELLNIFALDDKQQQILRSLVDYWLTQQLVEPAKKLSWFGQISRPVFDHPYIYSVPYIGSTNNLLLGSDPFSQFVLINYQNPWALTAEYQTSGKGRTGKKWHGEVGATILCSVFLPFSILPLSEESLNLIPLLASYSLYSSLKQLEKDYSVDWSSLTIKWPNDLYLYGKKLGGILVETHEQGLVIGFGINYSSVLSNSEIDQPWSRLVGNNLHQPVINYHQFSCEAENSTIYPIKEKVISKLVEGLITDLNDYHNLKNIFFSQWAKINCFFQGQPILLKENNKINSAYYQGIDQYGLMLVSDDHQGLHNLRKIYSAQVSVRVDAFV